MLKRLELVGFKSFADKTQFDFAPGLTAIVGPNGSGKSNIVDAVRWVLGEQSAKSLRGGEMADVIFNGSTSRRGLGLAEVTMTLDNSRRSLAIEAEEVQITRRVYRNGEGEYLINHQACRLKDIKDLFLGSGAGTEAYCVIEQGRVDVLLQASTRDRRAIFEEAAGISRFKARKIETVRKLERVDQNLQRLQDIIDEVEKQLRSVKLQAAKAQRYQEYLVRLRDLRVTLGLDEFHQLTERLRTASTLLEQLKAGLAERTSLAEASESDVRRLEEELARVEECAHEQEAILARTQQLIAAEETTLAHESSLAADLENELAQTRTRMAELNARVAILASAAAEAAAALDDVETQGQQQRCQVGEFDQSLSGVIAQLWKLHDQVKVDKARHLEQMRQAARLQNEVVSCKAQVENLRRERERLYHKTEQAAATLASLDSELQELVAAEEAVQARLAQARQGQAEVRQERERLRRLLDEAQKELATRHAQESGLAGRVEMLQQLERSHEGLGSGVREVLALRAQPDPGPWRTVIGMIADFLTVPHEYAPLIDLALGDRAQHFLVRDPALLAEALEQLGQPLSGRVSFLPLTTRDERREIEESGGPDIHDSGECLPTPSSPSASAPIFPLSSAIISPAAQLVTCESLEMAGLPIQLLGRTLLVRDLTAAREIAARTTGYRFITLEGELLEPDGTLVVGTHHAETGILSRKSELRELREQRAALCNRVKETEATIAQLHDQMTLLDSQAERIQNEIDVLTEQASDLRSRVSQHRQRRDGLHQELAAGRTEITGVGEQIDNLEAAWKQAQARAETAEAQVQELQAGLQRAEQQIQQLEQQRQHYQTELTAAKVALAQVEERLAALRSRHQQIQSDWQQRRQEQEQGTQYLAATLSRLAESQRTMLHASSTLADAYLTKEQSEQQLNALAAQREQLRNERQSRYRKAQEARSAWREEQEQAHARELELSDLQHRRDTLIQRIREDYQLDLTELYLHHQMQGQAKAESGEARGESRKNSGSALDSGPLALDCSVESQPPCAPLPLPTDFVEKANEEIEELRKKLERLGSVNLDSLEELAELESRAGSLAAQVADLNAAKRSLEDIIARINQDSRKLFTATLAAVRSHFQELFRKLFGGGMADIVLEDENDILESGIEIVARPPGKELRSISLMSGGEKTLTAVALLLAIFRSKPSPFCILDEVDAALDEANIGRFTAVLREFLDHSQFIIITHSKRTMTEADVLYGITMQESGISKRVAVRFEDWPDEERITANSEDSVDAGVLSGNGKGHAAESLAASS